MHATTFHPNAPANPTLMESFRAAKGVRMPDDYVRFLGESNGGEGFLRPNAYVILWPLEKLIELNAAYEVDEFAPGLFLFGSDGGGEALGFDLRKDPPSVVSVPFVGMDLAGAREVARSFREFLENPA